MRRRLLRATLLFLLAGWITAAPGFLSPAAHALPGNGSVTTYYSDSTHSTVVGHFEVFCGGKSALMGRTSPFFTTVTFVCP